MVEAAPISPFPRFLISLLNEETTMAKTIYATFPTESDAERAAGALMDHGVPSEDMSFIVPERMQPAVPVERVTPAVEPAPAAPPAPSVPVTDALPPNNA